MTIRFFFAGSLGRSDSHPAWTETARAATSEDEFASRTLVAKRGPAPYQVAVAAKSTVRRYTQTARLRQRLIDQRRETAAIALALRALTRELRSASDWPRTPTAVAASSPQFFQQELPLSVIRGGPNAESKLSVKRKTKILDSAILIEGLVPRRLFQPPSLSLRGYFE